jgi:hypothetical protein
MADLTIAIDELRQPAAATDLFVAALAQLIDRVMWPGNDEIVWLEYGGIKVAAIVNEQHGRSLERLRDLQSPPR